MISFPVPELVAEMRKLSDILASCQRPRPAGQIFIPAAEPQLSECLKAIDGYVTTLDLDASMAAVKDFIARLENVQLGFMDFSEVANRIDELRKCIERQLQGKLFMFIPTPTAKFFSEKILFGAKVSDKFPKAIGDIEEAGNCLAFDRFTACVFHLMRVMEVAVRRLGKRFQVQINIRDSWGDILHHLEAPIKALPQGNVREKQKRDSFLALHSHLYAVKEAWRNNTMHPKDIYTSDQAKDIFNHVKTFMEYLAGIL